MKVDPCCFAKGCDYATYPHGRGIFIFNVRKCYTIMENKVNAYNHRTSTHRCSIPLTVRSIIHCTCTYQHFIVKKKLK